MKAIVQDRFGSPDVLQFADVDPPEIGSDDVLVRVHAAAINPYDWHMLRGEPVRRPAHGRGGADQAEAPHRRRRRGRAG